MFFSSSQVSLPVFHKSFMDWYLHQRPADWQIVTWTCSVITRTCCVSSPMYLYPLHCETRTRYSLQITDSQTFPESRPRVVWAAGFLWDVAWLVVVSTPPVFHTKTLQFFIFPDSTVGNILSKPIRFHIHGNILFAAWVLLLQHKKNPKPFCNNLYDMNQIESNESNQVRPDQLKKMRLFLPFGCFQK